MIKTNVRSMIVCARTLQGRPWLNAWRDGRMDGYFVAPRDAMNEKAPHPHILIPPSLTEMLPFSLRSY
jgi:hypothetical protein